MKKTHVYFLVPLIGLIAFGAVYWNFSEGYEAQLAKEQADIRAKKEEKLREEAKNREKAIQDALAAQERRKAERAAKELKDKADAEARQLAREALEKAQRDQQKLAQQVERLEKDIKLEKDAIAEIEATKKRTIEEQEFLKTYVRQAESNVKSLSEVLDKIAAADNARAQAEALAARARNS
ncbi:hypothetical protein [Opitutus terrae]|uniref:Myosin heavy chain n=1 Tax=Opitutus terrae (strain DSM 11246 / JCM 15787 / PB90-1) TaxID=452637 RepID=B1ZQL5_OPITP|nr:hypothetical protein [Opitutus terrae]ACB75624.1 myosin heavy chain [Opitutus terrae PB90-1]